VSAGTYPDRLSEIRAGHRQADGLHPDRRDGWRDARTATFRAVLLDAAGTDPDRLDDDERAALRWLCSWDAETVAGVAALLDRARKVAP
jgi:hypothetical protein